MESEKLLKDTGTHFTMATRMFKFKHNKPRSDISFDYEFDTIDDDDVMLQVQLKKALMIIVNILKKNSDTNKKYMMR
ncbi:hypothetical protein F8M41_000431 [Gigaspora margarita]|uniref:Uncharacterized protein n=1 Tax=Gigaspora margarita TaxID=4874 RepID=A0A8H3XIJ8_GIGMA|nr:hypothetical protein F8M41_000431 [Gigaspora margarita]